MQGTQYVLNNYQVCATGEIPIFNPKFPFRNTYLFPQMATIFRSRAAPFLAARQILNFLPLRRPSFSKFIISVQAIITYNSSRPRPARMPTRRPTMGNARAFFTIFTRRAPPPPLFKQSHSIPQCPILVLETPIFRLKLVPEPPILYFAVAHAYPPPPYTPRATAWKI